MDPHSVSGSVEVYIRRSILVDFIAFPRSSLQNLIIGFYAFLVSPARQEIPMGVGKGAGRDQGIELGSREPRQSALGWAGSLQPTAGVGRRSCGCGPVSQSLPLPRLPGAVRAL